MDVPCIRISLKHVSDDINMFYQLVIPLCLKIAYVHCYNEDKCFFSFSCLSLWHAIAIRLYKPAAVVYLDMTLLISVRFMKSKFSKTEYCVGKGPY